LVTALEQARERRKDKKLRGWGSLDDADVASPGEAGEVFFAEGCGNFRPKWQAALRIRVVRVRERSRTDRSAAP